MPLSPGPCQKSVPAEEAHFINTKQLKFLLARSRWQVSGQPRGRGAGRRGGQGLEAQAARGEFGLRGWKLRGGVSGEVGPGGPKEKPGPEGWLWVPWGPGRTRNLAHPSLGCALSGPPGQVGARCVPTTCHRGQEQTTEP